MRAALILALALAGCGNEGGLVSVQVRLAFDPASCGSDDPAAVPFPCGGVIALHAFNPANDINLAGTCVPFAAAAGRTLADMPAVLEDAALDGLGPGLVVRVAFAAYSPEPGAGCPRYREGAVPRPVLAGESEPVTLAGEAPEAELVLGCLDLAARCLPPG